MNEIAHLLAVADAYKAATELPDVTVSYRVFGDSKKLSGLRDGSADITLGRYNDAFHWFSSKWPENAEWPRTVARPHVERAA